MSILQIVELSPSRVRGVVRYLTNCTNRRQKEAVLKSVMSPRTLPVRRNVDSDGEEGEPVTDRRVEGTQMIDKVIVGCERLGLVVRDNDEVALAPELPPEARSERKADARLPQTIAELIFSPRRSENYDLAQLIAWYLSQDPLNPPTNEHTVLAALHAMPTLHSHFDLKNQSYGQFEDWVVFLGLAWAGVDPGGKRAINPDPTAFLRRSLPWVLPMSEGKVVAASEVVRIMGEVCPVLETGRFREEILGLAGLRDQPGHISAATSQAWLRLEEEGFWSLIARSDAGEPIVLTDGTDARQVAAVRVRAHEARSRREST